MRIHLAIVFAISTQIAMTSNAAEVVFKDRAGRTLTKEDIQNASGTFNWEVRAGKPVPEEAKRLHELGRGAGQRGESKAAIEYFEKAAKVAPD